MHTVITHDLSVHQPGEKFCSIQLVCAGCVSISLPSGKSGDPEFSFSLLELTCLMTCGMSFLTIKALKPAQIPIIRQMGFIQVTKYSVLHSGKIYLLQMQLHSKDALPKTTFHCRLITQTFDLAGSCIQPLS